MTRPMIRIFPASPGAVYSAAVDAAEALGLALTVVDVGAHSLVARRPAGGGRALQITISVADNAFGGATVHVQAEGGRVLGRRSLGRRLLRGIGAAVGRPGVPPSP